MLNVIWIDREINNQVNQRYVKDLEELGYKRLRLFEKVSNAIEHMKSIKFEETKIIVSGALFSEFINAFKENIRDMYFAPKIIVFTANKKNFLEYNHDYEKNENIFYTFGGIATKIDGIKDFLKKENNNIINDTNDSSFIVNETENNSGKQFVFEYIDSKEKLLLHMFFKALLDKINIENMEEYTKSLYNKYSKQNSNIKHLLEQIINMKNIPIEILSKYYARLFTIESDFYKDMDKNLIMNNKDIYLPYIKTLYEGVRLRSLPLDNENILYCGSKLSNDEINKIKIYLNNKIEGLPSSIIFSKQFFEFFKERRVAEDYLRFTKNKNISKVLFILEKNENEGYNLCTHADIEKISYFPIEREVLFFPYSSFEIKDIKQINIDNEKVYEIRLLYLGKYLKDIENDKKLIINENKIPDTEFREQLLEVGLIKEEKIQNINTEILYNNYKQYQKDINNNIQNSENNLKSYNNIKDNKNIIIGEIYIKPENINKKILIINSFENCIREGYYFGNEEDNSKYENEKEIKENIEIKINEKIIPFSYSHYFEKEGKYIITYKFKNYLTKTNHMFYYCNLLTNLNLSNFNTKNVTNMSYMFNECNSLKTLILLNFNTKSVIDMSNMFCECYSLKVLDLSNFNTENVNNMSEMFYGCISLTDLNILNFNTKNVTDMRAMFYDCKSLTNLNISNFNTQSVVFMNCMFYGCNSLKKLNLSNFKTKNVKDMIQMFFNCKSLIDLNLSNFITKNVTNMNLMFDGCNSLKRKNLNTIDSKILKVFDNKKNN